MQMEFQHQVAPLFHKYNVGSGAKLPLGMTVFTICCLAPLQVIKAL